MEWVWRVWPSLRVHVIKILVVGLERLKRGNGLEGKLKVERMDGASVG